MAVVNCRRAWVETFDLALARPLQIGAASIRSRRGCYLHIEDEQGLRGSGECAPLPGLHGETLAAAAAQLGEVALTCPGMDLDQGASPRERGDLLPSVHFALTMACQSWRWQQEAKPQAVSPGVLLNGLVWAQECDLLDEVERLLGRGYRSIKVKVGRQSLDQDISRVHALKQHVAGRALLRLDGNRAWSTPEACRFGAAVGSEGIDYIEEPLRDPGDHTRFWQQTGIRVGLDETLAESPSSEVPVGDAIAALIIKPALLGPLQRTLQLIRLAQSRGIDAVLSSVFESPLALRFYARLAQSEGIAATPQGLDTWRCFAEHKDLRTLIIENGCMTWTEDG